MKHHTFPFKIFGDFSMEQHLNKFTIGHNELWDQINVPISIMSIFFWWLNAWSELLPQVRQVKGSCFSSIIFIPIDMVDLFTFGSEKTGEYALFKSSTTHDHIVSLIHFFIFLCFLIISYSKLIRSFLNIIKNDLIKRPDLGYNII